MSLLRARRLGAGTFYSRWIASAVKRPVHRLKTYSAALCLALVALVVLTPKAASSAAGGSVAGTVSATPDKYLAETVVYLKKVPGSYAPKTVEMDQKNRTFIPHVLTATVGDTVRFWNHDTVPHNVFSPEGKYNLGTWPPGESREHKFDKTGVFTQLCVLHPEMRAYVFVGQNPYAAVVDAAGHFSLKEVPPGKYELAVWNSHLKAAAQSIVVTSNKTTPASFALAR